MEKTGREQEAPDQPGNALRQELQTIGTAIDFMTIAANGVVIDSEFAKEMTILLCALHDTLGKVLDVRDELREKVTKSTQAGAAWRRRRNNERAALCEGQAVAYEEVRELLWNACNNTLKAVASVNDTGTENKP